ncbi:MAG: hypothetical protein GXO05_04740 [Aquificae bacterium]|nr:hypothetical protein [Aquificota bacterium]
MRWSINKLIFDNIRERIGIQPKQEEFNTEYHTVTRAFTSIDGKKINLTPLSFGFKGSQLTGPVVVYNHVQPSIALENLEGKVLYIKKIDQLGIFHYIKKASPLAVLTNTEFKKPLYIEEFPVFYLHSFLKQDSVRIDIKTKKNSKTGRNLYFDIGIGANFLFVHFPFDSRFSDPDGLSFHSSFNTAIQLAEKLGQVKHPKGFRIRFLFSDMYLSNYEGLKKHLKKLDRDRILAIFNIENAGVGNEKLILKDIENLLDKTLLEKVSDVFSRIEKELRCERLKDYSTIGEIGLPVIWFASQPNLFLYHLKKEFLNEKLISEHVNTIFYLINNIYKENG